MRFSLSLSHTHTHGAEVIILQKISEYSSCKRIWTDMSSTILGHDEHRIEEPVAKFQKRKILRQIVAVKRT